MGDQDTTGWRERLLHAVDQSGGSRQDISISAGLGRAYLYGIESEGKVPPVENLTKLCAEIGVSPVYVMFGIRMTPKVQELLDLAMRDQGQLDALLQLLRARR